jgi:hypothetical protein
MAADHSNAPKPADKPNAVRAAFGAAPLCCFQTRMVLG